MTNEMGDTGIVRLCDRALAGDYDANYRVAVLAEELAS